jgi:hypothetical protein
MPAHQTRISKSRPRSLGRAGWGAWVASLTIVIVAWAPLLGTLHRAFVRHVVCEHGDLIEPDERGAHPVHPSPAATFAQPAGDNADAAVTRGGGRSVHGHDHCTVGTLARSVAPLATSSPAGALLAEGRAVSLAARDANPVRSILSSAPKTSPPARQSSIVL